MFADSPSTSPRVAGEYLDARRILSVAILTLVAHTSSCRTPDTSSPVLEAQRTRLETLESQVQSLSTSVEAIRSLLQEPEEALISRVGDAERTILTRVDKVREDLRTARQLVAAATAEFEGELRSLSERTSSVSRLLERHDDLLRMASELEALYDSFQSAKDRLLTTIKESSDWKELRFTAYEKDCVVTDFFVSRSANCYLTFGGHSIVLDLELQPAGRSAFSGRRWTRSDRELKVELDRVANQVVASGRQSEIVVREIKIHFNGGDLGFWKDGTVYLPGEEGYRRW